MGFYSGDVHRPVWEKSRLAGTGRVADDLYLIAHDEISGRPCLSPRCAGIGVAGGLLAELMAAERPVVTLDRGCVVPLNRRYARPDEPLAAQVLALIAAESSPRPAGDWLLFLGKSAAAGVAGRLERCGYLTRPTSRIPGRTGRPVPVEPEWATCALLRAHAALNAARPLTPYLALLAGLASACGLGFRLSSLPDASDRSIGQAVQILPPVLRELIARVQGTADAAVLSNRT